MSELLPEFPYHPDPLATGSVVPSAAVCACCERQRGYLCTGPVHTPADLDDRLCPWCIADGSAAERYGVSFTGGIDGDVADAVWLTVDSRTPGFSSWQQDQWLAHCGDAAAFLGVVGAAELVEFPDVVETLRQEASGWDWPPQNVEHYLASLDKDGQPTAYLFRCRVCATHLAYSDFT
ncbi:UPF0167 protein [Streptomyces albospinus]|uniref:UPF0167 protein n=1 Tax=Streptomyces albospinus TaxID=285515 RepID=A0ABQ2VIA0_9ACTN|nr:UPF0167 protein [Streptomyces albospinus]